MCNLQRKTHLRHVWLEKKTCADNWRKNMSFYHCINVQFDSTCIWKINIAHNQNIKFVKKKFEENFVYNNNNKYM